MNMLFESGWRKVYGSDELTFLQGVVQLRLITWQTMKVREAAGSFAGGAYDLDGGIQRGQCDTHITGIDGDAFVAGPEDGMHAINAFQCAAAAARLPFITRHGEIEEIGAAGPLHKVTSDGSHI